MTTGTLIPGDKIPESCHLQLAMVKTTHYDGEHYCILYYCKIKKKWYAFNEDFSGSTPDDWKRIREKLKFNPKHSHFGSYAISNDDLLVSKPDVSKITLKPEHYPLILDDEPKVVDIPYHELYGGMEVIFAVQNKHQPEAALPTRGRLFRHTMYEWIILHNDPSKDGIYPKSLKTSEFKYGWSIQDSHDPYRHMIRFEIIGKPAHRHTSELGTTVPRNEQAELLMLLGEI